MKKRWNSRRFKHRKNHGWHFFKLYFIDSIYNSKECWLFWQRNTASKTVLKMKVKLHLLAKENLLKTLGWFQSESYSIIVVEWEFKICKKLVEFQAKKNFDSSAFENCTKLKKNIHFPQTFIWKSCSMNTAIQEYIVPENMKVVQQSTFKNCQNFSRKRFNVL